MRNLAESHELLLQDSLRGLTELAHRLAEVDTVMGKVFKQIADSGEGVALCELSLAEIHFLAAVAEFAPINGALLTKKLELTKGGVSKMATRLLCKGMIESSRSEGNRKSQYYILTANGRIACRIHDVLHKIAKDRILESISAHSDTELSLFNMVLKNICVALDDSSSSICSHFKKYLDKYGLTFG